jgi:AcrR family transcriptional regulator
VPRQSFQNLPLERRREILDTAIVEFAQSGYSRTSYNKLLERLGLGKSSAYYYFENKRDLFTAAVVDCYARFFEAVGNREEPKNREEFWSFVFESTLEGYAFMKADPNSSALMRCMQSEPELIAELGGHELLGSMSAFYETMIGLGQKLGAVRIDFPLELLVETTRGITLAFDRFFIEQSAAGEVDLRELSERYTDVVRRAVELRV